MADIHLATTTYPATLDTATTLTNDTVAGDGTGTGINANHQNYPAGAIIAIETELGTDPAGSTTDVKTRLAVAMNDSGTLKLGTAGAIGANLLASKGGTGIDTSASTGVPTISGGTWTVSTASVLQGALDTALGTAVLGDIIHGNSTPDYARLAGSTTALTKVLHQRGTGAVSAAPYWGNPSGDMDNVALASSVAASAWTIALKGEDGSDPAAANPVSAKVRSATLTTGTPVWMTRASALSLVIPNTATLGSTNGVAYRYWIAALTTDGTNWDALGIFNTQGTTQLYPLPSEGALHSATAITTGSDSAGVLYGSSATTSMPLKWIGYIEISEATAGVWDTEEAVIQILGPGVRQSGARVQSVRTENAATSSTTTVIPDDDTIPQITEGASAGIDAVLTPTSAINRLRIRTLLHVAGAAGNFTGVALFQDATANALKALRGTVQANGTTIAQYLEHEMRSATTTATTFAVRYGPDAASTAYLNQKNTGTRQLGGVVSSWLEVEEIFA